MLRGLFFQAWGFLASLKSQTWDPEPKVSPGGLVLRIFTSWKNPSTSAGFELANLDSRGEQVTPRPTLMSLILYQKSRRESGCALFTIYSAHKSQIFELTLISVLTVSNITNVGSLIALNNKWDFRMFLLECKTFTCSRLNLKSRKLDVAILFLK